MTGDCPAAIRTQQEAIALIAVTDLRRTDYEATLERYRAACGNQR
jgi:hypothetical protein